MPNGSIAFLVDTNVVVYAYDPTDAAQQARAITLLQTLESRRAGALTAQVLGEFFTTVTRKIKSPLTLAEAEQRVTNLLRAWPVFDITPVTVLEAIAVMQRRLSYWDALILATAKLNDVANVLSKEAAR